MFEIKVFDELPELLEYVAEKMMALSYRSEPCHIALSGGSTPAALYAFILNSPHKDAIQWHNLHFWWGDERMVPESSKESNGGEAKRALLDHVPVPKENIHLIAGDNEIDREMERLEHKLGSTLRSYQGRPSFDWVILGVGDDGHTASLFPGQVNYDAPENWVKATQPNTGQSRISLSAETLCNAQTVTFIVTGAGKAQIVDEIFADDERSQGYPAANIFAFEGQTEWLLDTAAASKLTKE